MLAFENHSKGNDKVPFDEIPHGILQLFSKWTGKVASRPVMKKTLFPLCPPGHVSITKGMHVMLVNESLVKQKAQGYPNLAKARAKLFELTQAGLDPRKPENRAKVKETKAAVRPDDSGLLDLVPAIATGRVYTSTSGSYRGPKKASAQVEIRNQQEGESGVGQVVNSLTCMQCSPPKQFNTKSTLSHHRMMAHSNRRYDCAWALQGRGCDRMGIERGYSTKANLKKHYKSTHNGIEVPPPKSGNE
ncbi:uncharacterized protein HMPREF1541_07917 [Cyphellophora europaea CBS 101466]|uniref:Uncharacterized protein n=1 Tax=Cyphellophora europaea (strain CBS 101466) TaxID=1220924 RepID=W2RKU6_CYPE1|nr:uncharacterized protein HMPREF1541_07917 [Cyphellophora europaea CBS 101466]ETN36930.1 hypothetical protein HMPREF1541_07917 [Cyphellophora europaea CBS 101466]